MIDLGDVLAHRYHLVRPLGHGGTSDVYEARDDERDVAVAVKILRSADDEVLRRFDQEARALEMLVHPGLVRLLDAGEVAGRPFLVMELVDGRSLADAISLGPLGAAQTAQIGAQVSAALAYAHGMNVVHRDVKPSNVLLSDGGDAKLSDFGIARLVDDSTITVTGAMLGTAAYMAPEQLEDHHVTASADIWSLGIVLLECLTGARVYQGSPSQVITQRLSGPVPMPADLPVPWKILLAGMLDHRPDQRLTAASAAELLATSQFQRDWRPSAPLDDHTMVAAFDLTGLSQSPGGRNGDGATQIVAPIARARPLEGPTPNSARGRVLIGAGLAVALAVGFLVHSPTAQPTSTSTTSPTTSTTVPPKRPSGAFGAIAQTIATDLLQGALPATLAQSLNAQVSQALVDAGAGNTTQATSDLNRAWAAITSGVASGSVAPLVGQTLEGELISVASALGVPLTSVTTTTSPAPVAPGPGPGQGHGHGRGNH